jgi:hypothetical protein
MSRGAILLLLLIAPVPEYAHAAACNVDGYSVVYINGIFTDETKARIDTQAISDIFQEKETNKQMIDSTNFHTGYNATHLLGFGDVLKSVLQKMWEVEGHTKEDYDLERIVTRIQPEVKTQKILILGHSQGTFYANALYDYLVRRGVSAKSIAVLNLATPASFVGGHGKHLTNTNDMLVQNVRSAAVLTSHPEPLVANLDISPVPGDTGLFSGHSLSSVYLKEKPVNIASAIASSLSKLQSDPTRDPSQPCIPSPDTSIAHVAKGMTLAVADALSYGVDIYSTRVPTSQVGITRNLANALVGLAGSIQESPAVVSPVTTTEVHAAVPEPIAAQYVPNQVTPQVDALLVEQPTAIFIEPLPAPLLSQPTPPVEAPPVTGFGGLLSLDPGFGASSGGTAPSSLPSPASAEVRTSEVPAVPSATVPVITASVPLILGTTTVTITGTSTDVVEVFVQSGAASTTTIPKSDGTWGIVLVLEEGEHTLEIVGRGASVSTDALTKSVTIDITPPSPPTLSVIECSTSLSPTSCVLATTTATMHIVTDTDTTRTLVTVLGATSTTAADDFMLTLPDRATTTITVVAEDAAGNISLATTTTLSVFTKPLLITEVAWAGTTALASDEWIEITNVSPYAIDMSRAILRNTDDTIRYPLVGTLAPYHVNTLSDTYLIEQRSNATNMTHSQLEATLALSDTGDQLFLEYDAMVMDSTPRAEVCGGWCGGALKQAIRYSDSQGPQQGTRTMERVNLAYDGSVSSAWQTNDTYLYGTPPTDASGNPILGSPSRDTREWFKEAEWMCASRMQEGVSYVPGTGVCTYYSGFMHTNARRYGTLFKGSVGSSTVVSNHSLTRSMISVQNGDDVPGAVSGDAFFVAIYETRNGPSFSNDMQQFHDYFTGISPTPPHSNYRVIPWTYGTTP